MASRYENHEAISTSTEQTTKIHYAKLTLATLRKIDTGIPALVVALCSNCSKLNVQIQIRCHVKIVESFPLPQPRN